MFQTTTEPRKLPKSETTIASILEAASPLFLAQNYSHVTMNDIASACRLTKGALYHHFASKEELYLAMMHSQMAELRAIFSASMEGQRDAYGRLRSLTRAFLTLPGQKRDVMKLVRRDINVFAEPARTELIHAYQSCLPEQVETAIRKGMVEGELRTGDARLLSWQFVAAVEVTLSSYSNRIFRSIDDKLDFVLALFFDGARNPKREKVGS
jgi:AcrR family transcriptional regulator